MTDEKPEVDYKQVEKHFQDLNKEQQQAINERDLKEMCEYYGGWQALREVIKNIEDNENEAKAERHYSGGSDAWSGGFADNH